MSLLATQGRAHAQTSRPPQFVLLAFDGSLNLDRWRDTLQFAQDNDIKFTYFISGVYFLLDAKKRQYVEPTHGPGRSAIGFGGPKPEEIAERIAWVNKAYDSGHEIGSHVNGHYDGTKWTYEQWSKEFDQFPHLVFDAVPNNGLTTLASSPFHFTPESIVGFRAPLLGHDAATYEVLAARHFKYDTSKTAEMAYWPQREHGIWNFPLAQLRIAGTGKRTLSMDYNFYFAQSGGKEEPAREEEFRTEMLKTYLAYFANNYLGNRAPVHIGHHFGRWNGGAYWNAMQEFAKAVCHLPEVKCVTYRELSIYLDSLPKEALVAYQEGRFEKSEFPEAAQALARAEPGIEADLVLHASADSNIVSAEVAGAHAARVSADTGALTIWKIDGKTVASGAERTLDLSRHRHRLSAHSRLSVSVIKDGKEVLRSTHDIST
ncbi:MAG TPA: polysaccharide deacetylase family protein, partial [Polyangiales bacterium]